MIALCLQTPSGISLAPLLLSLVAIGTLAAPNLEYSILNCQTSWSASSLPKAYNDSGKLCMYDDEQYSYVGYSEITCNWSTD